MNGRRWQPEHAYAGGGPNPHLSEFVQWHLGSAYGPSDAFDVGPFTESIRTTKQSSIYALHGYHLGKKPHDAIRAYVRHFTRPGDLVLDPFSGSGSTALAALMDGRKAIAIDASPAATFIARYYVTPIDPEDFTRRFDAWVARVRDEVTWLYGTTCHRCGGSATLHHVVYSNTYACPQCSAVASLFEANQLGGRCPRCAAGVISSKLRVVGYVPVAATFSCHGRCSPRRTTRSICGAPDDARAFESIDRRAIEELESRSIPHPVPEARMMHVQGDAPWGDEWRPSRDFRTIRELFTHRNLWAISAMMEAAGDDLDLRALLTSGMLAVSRKAQHLDRGGGYIPGNWALPPMSKQRNVLESLTRVFRRAREARVLLRSTGVGRDVCLSTQSATDLSAIADASVDYVFTDPPYGGAVQYAELNFLWEAWLGFDTGWHEHEIIVNHTRGRTAADWAARLTLALRECHRVLKPGRWISICYHDASNGTWGALQDAVEDAGFVLDSTAVAIDTGGRTYNQYTVDKATQRDLVLGFRKRHPNQSHTRRDTSSHRAPFEERARSIIVEYLRANPGASKSRVYDDLIARLLMEGEVRPHDFESLLRSVAEERFDDRRVVSDGTRKGTRQSIWYLTKNG